MFTIKTLSNVYVKNIAAKIDGKTKPLGALGQLETLASQLANIQAQQNGQWQNIELNNPAMLVFAGDHGIAKQGVSIAPSEVTQQMVLNFLSGGAAVNCFCRTNSIALSVIDTGILVPIEQNVKFHHGDFYAQRIAASTNDFSQQAAMTLEQVNHGLEYGAKVVREKIAQGTNIVMFGEMGIGNTSSAAAIISLLLKLSVQQSVGRGTGITDQQFTLKQNLIEKALQRVGSESEPLNVLAHVGGFEIVQMVGAMLAAAEAGITLLIDGFIVSAAALVAAKINANARDYMVFAHQSNEQAHQLVLEALQAKPLLNLDLRLGEGTGAALAYPLLQAAVSFYNDMASFESAGVTV